MRKFLLIVLVLVLVLALGFLGLCLYYEFFKEPDRMFTKAEAEQMVLGVWEDPLGQFPDYEFKADGTGTLGDLPVSWEMTRWENSSPGLMSDFFIVLECRTRGDDKVHKVYFNYYQDPGYITADAYSSQDAAGKPAGTEEDLYPEIHRKSALYRYKSGTYELVTLDTSNWEDYFQIVQKPYFSTDYADPSKVRTWSYSNFVVLKPEYISRTLNQNNNDYQYGCIYQYWTTPYLATADYDKRTVTLGEVDLGGTFHSDVFRLPNEDTIMIPSLTGGVFLDEEDYIYGIALTEIQMPLDVVRYNDEPLGTANVITDYILHDCRGKLLLLK